VWKDLELPAGDLYCEVQFADAVQAGQSRAVVAQNFWNAIARGNVLQLIKDRSNNGLFKRRVFVYVGYKGAFGCLAWKLLNRPQAGGALAVHGLGGRNAVPCKCCENNWASMRAGSDQVPTFVPFWECVSLPGAFQDACSNCLYHETQTSCCYRTKEFHKEFGYGALIGSTKKRRGSGNGVESSIPKNISSVDSTQFFRANLMSMVESQRREFSYELKDVPCVLEGTIWAVDNIPWEREVEDDDEE